ncbi:MAG: hypothetical protein ABIG44_10415 [Planctomycetota bacterium]
MEYFIQWLSAIGAICIGVMLLAAFFMITSAIGRRVSSAKTVLVKGFLPEAKRVDVILTSGKVIKSVTFQGFTSRASEKNHVPHHLANMAVFHDANGRRIMIRPDSIRIIEEVAEQDASGDDALQK